MNILGIDPGKEGGLCLFKGNGNIILRKMPETPTDLYNLLELFKKASEKEDLLCFLEKVQGQPKQSGMFNFGKGFGYLEMALIALKIPTETVTPQKWQKHFQMGETKGAQTSTIWKNKLKAKAQQMFPKLGNLILWQVDALLIAEYGRKNS